MTIAQALQQFYKENNFAEDGGLSEDTFELKFRLFSIKLPNSKFRKDVIHIHDIQHVLYNCDTTWKGESFIAGWEIATGFWKYFPIGFMSLWAMGFSFLNYPKEVFKGYKSGLQCKGIMDLKMPKKELLNIPVDELRKIISKNKPIKMNVFQWVVFILWILLSEIIFLFPLLMLTILILSFY
ncbi:MAG: hypothetical protein ACPGUU_01950 [Flavobacteriaceae bacterium]